MGWRSAGWIRSRPVRWLAVAGIVITVGMGGCSHLAEKERELTFRVVQGNARWYGGLPDGVQELNLPVTTAATPEHIHAWWWPAAQPDAPAVLYFHGSRWNLTGQLTRIRQLHEFGFSVLAIDYRGFGQSGGGVPSEQSVYEDARVAWKRFAELVPDAGRRFIYGHSLGGAVAVDLAAELDRAAEANGAEPARGLIVESSFTTLVDVAKALSYSWLPVQWILSQKFDTLGKITQVKMPVLFVHGAADRFIPARFSQTLYDAAHAPKKLLVVEGATHNNSMRVGTDEYRDALRALFRLPDGDASMAPRRHQENRRRRSKTTIGFRREFDVGWPVRSRQRRLFGSRRCRTSYRTTRAGSLDWLCRAADRGEPTHGASSMRCSRAARLALRNSPERARARSTRQ